MELFQAEIMIETEAEEETTEEAEIMDAKEETLAGEEAWTDETLTEIEEEEDSVEMRIEDAE